MSKNGCVVSLIAGLSLASVAGFAQTTPAATAPATSSPMTPKPASPAAKPVTPPRSAKAKKPVTPARPTPVLTIPKTAVKTPEGAYRYKDPQGKTWLYRETPFGLSRVEETPRTASAASVQTPFGATKVNSGAAAQPAQPAMSNSTADSTSQITATAKGDKILFKKPTPFGMTSWQKSKDNLTSDEQKVWDREQARQQGGNASQGANAGQAGNAGKETH